MFRSYVGGLVLFAVVGCASGGSTEPRSSVVPGAKSIEAIDWSKRDGAAPLWPETESAQVTLLITSGATVNDHLLWIVEGPRKLDHVFRVSDEQIEQVSKLFVNIPIRRDKPSPHFMMLPGSQGIFKGTPPPPPPQPIGIPGEMREHVLDYVDRINIANERFVHDVQATP